MNKPSESTNPSFDWEIRKAIASDIPFIYDSFLKCLKHGSSIGKSCRSRIFFDNYKEVLDALLQRSEAYIACLPDSQTTILGYLIAEPELATLHMIFVKEAFRALGVGRSLFIQAFPEKKIIYCSHKTFETEEVFKTHPHLEFNPFVLYKKE